MWDSNLPDDFQIDVGKIVSDDVAHATHFSEGKLGVCLTGRLGQMGCGSSYDFNPPDHRPARRFRASLRAPYRAPACGGSARMRLGTNLI